MPSPNSPGKNGSNTRKIKNNNRDKSGKGNRPAANNAAGGGSLAAGPLELNGEKTKLFRDIMGGDYKAVLSLLKSHPVLLNSRSEEGLTPLTAACRAGKNNIVGLLLSLKMNPKEYDMQGKSPLDIARETGNAPLEKMLEIKIHRLDAELAAALWEAEQAQDLYDYAVLQGYEPGEGW
jgi:hypothetical protein